MFGVCMGNQLMGLAAGAKTFKMGYGNRGLNQPCVDTRTGRCHITSQNHGYVLDNDTVTITGLSPLPHFSTGSIEVYF
jgi:carbamoylphosphate synthase small subunit